MTTGTCTMTKLRFKIQQDKQSAFDVTLRQLRLTTVQRESDK